MKRILKITALAFSVMLLSSLKNTSSAQPGANDDISYQNFYDELSPHGSWMDYPEYGYVWVPNTGPDFRPYSTNGHWAWSDEYEWIWVSDYSWGWAPFHYGRWFSDSHYGWMWLPGYEWSPAWVAWRGGGDYYGWAPLRPGINISINFSIGSYNPPIDYWCFAPRRYITSPRIYDYYVPYRNNVTIINQTTIINNYNYNRNVFRTGPGRRDAERYAGRINPVRFRDVSAPGRAGFRNNEVSVYRPRVRQNDNNNRSIAPRTFNRYERNNDNNGNAINRNNTNTNTNSNNRPQRRLDANRGNDNARQNDNNRTTNRRENTFNRDNRNNQPRNDEGRNRQIERPRTNNDRPESRDVNRNNNNNGRNNEQQTRPVDRRNISRQNDNSQDRSRNRVERNNVNRNNNSPSVPNRNEVRNNNRSEQSSGQINRERPQPRQFENRSNGNNREQRGGNDNPARSGRRR